MILKKATVPMCPDCGAEMVRGTGRAISFLCDNCMMCVYVPDWGVYVPDVEAVAREMEAEAFGILESMEDNGDGRIDEDLLIECIGSWARRLRGEKP